MKFQKGSRVEVMNKTELPTSWCVAEVVSGNGHTYSLRYDCYPGVEKVSREFIRPCPPRTKDLPSWMAGDIVEVFDDNSWKTATVCNVSDGGHFSVRPHGFTHEIHVHKSNIRARQSWQDGQWVPIVKISGNYGDVNVNQMVEPHCDAKLGLQIPVADAKIRQEKDSCLVVYNDAGLQESRVVSSKTLKRASPFCSSHLEASPGNAKKFKATEKEHRRRFIPDQSLEKVDALDCPRETLGYKKSQASSFHNTVNGFNELEKGNLNGVVGCSLARISEPNDDQCSVGSCSISSDGPNKWSSPYTRQETDIFSSDAESFNTSKEEDGNRSPPSEVGVAASIHRLELHAYCSTLEALYASGPLSWEKEALLTNLRISLHISNDEHLTELRHLISAGAGILD